MRWLGMRVLALFFSICSSALVSEGLLELGACCWGGRIPAASITEGGLLFLLLAGAWGGVSLKVLFGGVRGGGGVLAALAPELG